MIRMPSSFLVQGGSLSHGRFLAFRGTKEGQSVFAPNVSLVTWIQSNQHIKMASLGVAYFACAKSLQLCLILCNPMDYSSPGSSVHGILQARILERGAIPFSRGSPPPMDRTQVFCIAGKFFSVWATRKPLSSKLIICKMFPMTSIFENIHQQTIMHRFRKEYLAKGTP